MRSGGWAGAVFGRFQHPAQVIATGFGTAILLGTLVLALPIATESGSSAGLLTALFTATSAVCVTGLVVVGTAGHWSVFGEVVIAALIQVGGLGIMTLATLFTVLVAGRLGLWARLFAPAGTKTLNMSDVRRVVRNVVLFSLVSEAVLAVVNSRSNSASAAPASRSICLGVGGSVRSSRQRASSAARSRSRDVSTGQISSASQNVSLPSSATVGSRKP